MYITCAVWFLLTNMHRYKQTHQAPPHPPAPSASVRQCRLSHPHRVDKHPPQQQPLPPAQQLVEGEAEGRQRALLPPFGPDALAVGGTVLPAGVLRLPAGASVALCLCLGPSSRLPAVDSFGRGAPCLLAAACWGGRADSQRGQREGEAFAFL